MSFDLTALSTYTDELSLDLIAKAVLTTDLMNEIDVRSGLSAGTVAINIMDGDLNVGDLACGWNPSGDVNFSQVDISIADKQVKMELCPEDLRQYWLSQRMSAGADQDSVPFEETIAAYYVERVRKYNEGFLINGDGTVDGIKAQITGANGANVPSGAAAWTVANAVDQALDLFDAIDESVKDREDLIMVVSPANFQTLRRALVAQNYFHYDQGDGRTLELPGTNLKVVKSSGLVGSNYVAAGPAGFMVAGTGLESDFETMQFVFDKGEDVVKFIAKWRLGIAVHQVNLFATNDLA
jgi:hypothetical protein